MDEQPGEDHQKPWLKIALIAGAVVVVLGTGAGAYYIVKHRQPAVKPVTSGTNQQQPITPDQTSQASRQQYISNGKDLKLNFSYPSTWSATPDSNNNTDDKPIIVTSPLVTLASSTGHSVTGKVIVQIRPVTTTLTEFASGKAATSQDSVQIGYDKPTASHHQYPYITFVALSGANATGAFNEVLITGISSYPKNIPISSDSLQIDPVISATFYQCATRACTTSALPLLSISSTTWQTDTT